MHEYRVFDVQTEPIDPTPKLVMATSAERAAALALGINLVRSGSKKDLRARVYCQHPGQPLSMVRLYTKVADRQSHA